MISNKFTFNPVNYYKVRIIYSTLSLPGSIILNIVFTLLLNNNNNYNSNNGSFT